MSKRVERETKVYEDGSKTVEDVYMKKDGKLFVNTYNVTADEKKHDHSAVDEDGNYMGGHEEKTRKWENRDFALQWLSTLSFIELQMVEEKSKNSYIKRSARYFMQNVPHNTDMLSHENTKKLVKTLF